MKIPGKLTGTHPLVNWLNKLEDWLLSDRLVSVVGGKLQQTTTGRVLTIDRNAGGVSAEGVALQMFRVKSITETDEGDYVTCRTWDGTNEGATDIPVAKPYKLRKSPWHNGSAIIDGVNVSYIYSTNVKRTASVPSGYSEVQVVVPRYLVNDVIFAAETETGVTDASWLDINADGRAWARKYQQDI